MSSPTVLAAKRSPPVRFITGMPALGSRGHTRALVTIVLSTTLAACHAAAGRNAYDDSSAYCRVEACADRRVPRDRLCADGTHSGATGRCLGHSGGCDWELRGCPEDSETATSLSSPTPRAPTTETFEASLVRERLRSVQQEINRCYEQLLAADGPIADAALRGGRVHVQFVVDESGTFGDVVTSGDFDAIEPCIVRVLTGLRVSPGPVGGSVRFSTAFVYSSDARVGDRDPTDLRLVGLYGDGHRDRIVRGERLDVYHAHP